MLNSKDLLILFKKKKINFFTGVPDSVLKNFLHVVSKEKKISHLVAVNEGSAVALAIGNYLNTKRVPLVYMQNSGLGVVLSKENFVNPPPANTLFIILYELNTILFVHIDDVFFNT